MTAYLGLQESSYNRLLAQAEQSAQAITNDQLEQAAPDQETADNWLQLNGNYTSCSSIHVMEQHQQYADRTCSAMALKHQDNYTYATQCHSVQEALVTLPSYSNHNWMKTSSRRALQHGSFNSPSTNKTTEHYYRMQSTLQSC